MKKTIAAMALIASSNALAIAPPVMPGQPQPKVVKYCLSLSEYETEAGKALYAGCDESSNNKYEKRQLLENGCAEGQVALSIQGGAKIRSCMPPGMVQL